MTSPWRPAGFSFALRLLALLLAPLLGVGVLALQRIETEQTASAGARSVVDDARLQQDVAAVYAPSQLEQVALEGLAAVDALGVDRDIVVSVTGVDFERVYGDNGVLLDSRLDDLIERHGSLPVGGSTLSTRLTFIRGALATQRRLSGEFRATEADVRFVFADLNRLLADALATRNSTASTSATPGLLVADQMRLTALSDMLSAAGGRGTALLDGLLNRTEAAIGAIELTSGRLDYAIERYRSLTVNDTRFAEVVDGLQPVPEELLSRSLTESTADVYDPAYIQTSAGALLNQLEFLASLATYSGSVHETVVNSLEADAVAANSVVSNTRLFAATIAIVSLAALIVLAWSTLRPLRRLTRRARDISDGSFDVEPLPERGPLDVRILTTTMNSMATTLRMVDREIADLASDTPGAHDRKLPGAIGISITRSFDRLEEVSARLHESEQLASAIVEHAADAIWTIDARGSITSANGASVTLTGVAAARQVGEPLDRFLPRTAGEVDVRNAAGETFRVLVASSEITSGDQPLTTVIAHDISERLRFEEKLAYQANHDALTGLPNRYAVLEALSATPDDEAVSVLFIDLDGFKSVNDTRGHVAGDRVLTDVGNRLSTDVRPGDFVGRLGGDEFVVIMRHAGTDDDAISFAHRLIREIEQPYHDGEHLFALSASVGIATFPRGLAAEDVDALGAIRRADSAVYAAKGKGRGRVEAFDERLQTRIVEEAEIELGLRSARGNDAHEMHVQPVFDAVLGRFTSAEALVRWHRPGHGMMPPGHFIPIAERSSLIDEIGRWVLQNACTTLAHWAQDDELRDLRIAINVAGSHLLDGDLVADLDAAVRRTGADPTRLEFELTETQLMVDHERAATILQKIRQRGIKVAIDDFGTGYSSMAYLRQLPIDTLKIDRSFIAPIGGGGPDADVDTTVVDALLTIGHALGLSVVAEGVETIAQLEYVTTHGADRVQGFLLARPTPVAEAETLLRQRRPVDVAPAPALHP